MKDQQVEEMIDKLKQHYDDMPIQSSSAKIMSKIDKEKQPRWGSFFHKWQAVAMIVLAFGIGSVLTVTGLNHFSLNSVEEQNELFVAKSSDKAVDEAQTRTFDHQESTNIKESEHSIAATSNEVTTEIISLEGTEEQITVKPVVDQELGFRTMIDERYEVDSLSSGESHSFQVFANYTGEKITPHFFSVTEFYKANQSLEQLESLLRDQYAASELGYEERLYEHWFKQQETGLEFVSELKFEASGSIVYVGIVEQNNTYYCITVNFIGEMYERIGADAVVMLRHAQFE
ncbi:hypothetical protein GN156_09965 [bacterium LRH843]|nr:hypothetical protein [bacterium LRH843]